jgi:hypothetical protein
MVAGHCRPTLSFSFYWHLAIQWQDMPDTVALVACTDPSRALVSFSHGLPRPLVVIKAWRDHEGASGTMDRFKEWRIDGWSQWYKMNPAIHDFLKQQVKDDTLVLKSLTKALISDGKVLWRPLEPSKAEIIKDTDWPPYVTDARSMVLHLLVESRTPLRMPVLVEMASAVYKTQTIYNAVNKLKKEGLVSPGAWAELDYGALRLTRSGQYTAKGLEIHGRAKGARSLVPRM